MNSPTKSWPHWPKDKLATKIALWPAHVISWAFHVFILGLLCIIALVRDKIEEHVS